MSRCVPMAMVLALTLGALPANVCDAFDVGSRWNRTATDGTNVGSQGSPVTLTWSFAADGTTIPDGVGSNLISFLDTNLGAGLGGTDFTQRPWFPRFQQSFDRITALSGVTYVYEPNDDSRSFANSTSARGALGVRGDIRIGGKSYDNTNTLASNFYPSYGEMMINTDRVSFYTGTSNNNRGFRNVIMHEAMHGLGIRHVKSSTHGFLIEPTISTSFDGPQLDDLLAIQRLYGDFYEKNGGNDTFSAPTPIGIVTPTQSRQLGTLGSSTVISSTQTDFLSIDDNSDTDFFSFTIDSRLDVTASLTPRGTTYQVATESGTQASFNSLALSDLSLALFDTNGTSLLGSSNSSPAGAAEELTRQLMPGTYYARVTGAEDNIQLYGLLVSAAAPTPANMVWVGNINNGWDTGVTANFSNAGVPTVFWELDNVQFDDTSPTRTVEIASPVSAGAVQVTTAGEYVFSGTAGIASGSLTIDGGGTVELANAGNSYTGITQVAAGTLAITGDASAMQSSFIVDGGAKLVMDATDAATMTSSFTVEPDAELQIGTPESTGNVFPDNPSAIVNDGTIRVFSEESLRAVSGGGTIVIEQEMATLSANPDFHGEIVVKSGAAAKVMNDGGLGSFSARTTVEEGAELVLNSSSHVSGGIEVAGDGAGAGAIQVTANHNATFLSGLTLIGDAVLLHADADATGTFTAPIDGIADETDLVMRSELGANLRLQGGLALDAGGVTKSGSGTAELGGLVSYTGDTVIEGGTLRLTGEGTLAGTFRLDGGATLEHAGTNAFSSEARLAGSGQVIGDLLMPGTIAPGASAGTLTLTDDLSLVDTSVLELELGGTQAGIDFDLLQVIGQVTLDGALAVSLLDDFIPTVGDSFGLLTADGGLSGVFDAAMLPTLADGLAWHMVYDANTLRLEVDSTAIALAGDYNGNGIVDAADYTVWRDTLGSTTDFVADGDQSQTIDQGDYEVWVANFGTAPVASTAAVPEPNGAAVLLGVALLMLTSIKTEPLTRFGSPLWIMLSASIVRLSGSIGATNTTSSELNGPPGATAGLPSSA
ncbi:MAG: autotransporter-associated beta strand repeat-containing protein [Pirellulales bacterium]